MSVTVSPSHLLGYTHEAMREDGELDGVKVSTNSLYHTRANLTNKR